MISVIVPVYNVEMLLPRCVDSILAQTYTDFELLLIDDGSRDHSGMICDQYSDRDRRIRVYHKRNGGLSDARNFGLERMQGEYVTFIDSDDFVGQDYLKLLLEMMGNCDVDVTAVSFENTYTVEPITVTSEDRRHKLYGNEILKEMLCQKWLSCSACAKLFKKDLFYKRRFPVGKLFEDLLTIPYIFKENSICVCSTSKQYYYFQRKGSIMNSVSEESIHTWLEGMDKLREYINRVCPANNPYVESMFVQGVFWRAIDWKLYDDGYMEFASGIRHNYARSFKRALLLPQLTLKERLKAFLFYLNERLYRKVRIEWIKRIFNPDSRHFLR